MTAPENHSSVLPAAGGTAHANCMDVVGLAAAVIRSLLTERARNGVVALDDANRILDEVTDAGGAFARMMTGQPALCPAAAPPRHHVSGRKDSFRRLMVRPFEPLLEGEPAVFSREFLPQFFTVVDAIGGEWRSRTESACRTVLQSLVIQHGHGLTWEHFYTDPRVHRILTHALRHLVAYLETPAGQWLWEQAMLRPSHNGRTPVRDQVDKVYAALVDSWRALEMEGAQLGREAEPRNGHAAKPAGRHHEGRPA